MARYKQKGMDERMTRQRMVELLEIEKECVRRNGCGECNRACYICDLLQDDTELHEMYEEVIALVKAQEPRVLALEEIHRGMAVWLEDVDKTDVILAIGGSSGGGCKCFITVDDRSIAPCDSDYGVRWRAWTREPTAEQRRETHWM